MATLGQVYLASGNIAFDVPVQLVVGRQHALQAKAHTVTSARYTAWPGAWGILRGALSRLVCLLEVMKEGRQGRAWPITAATLTSGMLGTQNP